MCPRLRYARITFMEYEIIVIGAGISGITLAERLANILGAIACTKKPGELC
jgi:pyruvate/2-oxoglutarate dehydrogenase complex dihydrolipoamide dehydrogenase (E3) component